MSYFLKNPGTLATLATMVVINRLSSIFLLLSCSQCSACFFCSIAVHRFASCMLLIITVVANVPVIPPFTANNTKKKFFSGFHAKVHKNTSRNTP